MLPDMTRIIAGDGRGAALAVPKSGTRPTSDRVREAIFSALEAADVLEGVEVLDLCAGTGALGLEALSRGAASATLVEKAPKAAAILKRNAGEVERAIRAAAPKRRVRVRVETASAQSVASTCAPGLGLVFIDPPYEAADAEVTAILEAIAPKLEPWALVVLERSTRSGLPELPASLALERTKAYGETAIHYLERADRVREDESGAEASDF